MQKVGELDMFLQSIKIEFEYINLYDKYRKSLCRDPQITKNSIIFRGGYDKGYKIFIADENLFVSILIFLLVF